MFLSTLIRYKRDLARITRGKNSFVYSIDMNTPFYDDLSVKFVQGKVYIYFGTGKDRKWTQKPDITLTCQVKFIIFFSTQFA